MAETRCRVVDVSGDRVLVEPDGSGGGCGRCDPRQGCQAVSFARLFCTSPRRLEVPRGDWQARAGDSLVIGIPEGGLARGIAAAYLIPLLALLLGAGLGRLLGLGDLASAGTGIAALCAGLLAGRGWLASPAARERLSPVILRRA